MRILAVSSWWPEPADNGSRMRIAHLLRALAREHEVHLVALSQGPIDSEQLRRIERVCASAHARPQRTWRRRRTDPVASLWRTEPASVRGTWDPGFATLVQERAGILRPDLVIAFEVLAAPYARSVSGTPRLLDELQVTRFREAYLLGRPGWGRLRAWLTWHKLLGYLTHLLRDFDACSVSSAAELAQVRALAPPSALLTVVPNGADVEALDGTWGEPEPDTLIYPGALSWDDNLDAMTSFLGTSFPAIRAARPSARLTITGAADPARVASLPRTDGVVHVGYVPDVRPLVARSWCEVVPLRVGGGTRLKVLEALALGTPVVSTPKGVEGLDLRDGTHVLVAGEPIAFAEATVRLLAHPELRARLAVEGRRIVRERYDWRSIGRRFVALARATVSSRARPA